MGNERMGNNKWMEMNKWMSVKEMNCFVNKYGKYHEWMVGHAIEHKYV